MRTYTATFLLSLLLIVGMGWSFSSAEYQISEAQTEKHGDPSPYSGNKKPRP